MEAYEKLIFGYKEFRQQYLSKENDSWRFFAKERQNPRVMMISCSDSRVNPVIITHASLGDIFIVNNVANLVPPYHEGEGTHHSTSAAIEFAVNHLHVEHIIIMGHSGCGGIKSLMMETHMPEPAQENPSGEYSFIKPWMKIVSEAADFTEQEVKEHGIDGLSCQCERRASLISLNNLAGFPWVKRAMKKGDLKIHAWHFDIGSGILEEYDYDKEQFKELE
jgi:carbonic anhydrase